MVFKKYLEIIEQGDEGVELKTVQVEVKDKKEAESKMIETEKEFENKKYIARYHICKHGEHGKNQPCECEILKEIK